MVDSENNVLCAAILKCATTIEAKKCVHENGKYIVYICGVDEWVCFAVFSKPIFNFSDICNRIKKVFFFHFELKWDEKWHTFNNNNIIKMNVTCIYLNIWTGFFGVVSLTLSLSSLYFIGVYVRHVFSSFSLQKKNCAFFKCFSFFHLHFFLSRWIVALWHLNISK